MPPASSRGLLLKQQALTLPADLEGGSTTKAEGTAVRGDHLDPECILVLEVGGLAGLTQRIQAGLLRARGRCVEAWQLQDHPGAFVQLRQPQGHGRPFGSHLDLGTGADVGARQVVVLAIAAEYDWRLGRGSTWAAGSSTRCATRAAGTWAWTPGSGRTSARTTYCQRTGTGTGARTRRSARTTGPAGTGTGATRCAESPVARAGDIQATDIALAYRSVPVGLDLTGLC